MQSQAARVVVQDHKLTAALAVLLFLTSILLTVTYNKRTSSSVMDTVQIPAAAAPAVPAAETPADTAN